MPDGARSIGGLVGELGAKLSLRFTKRATTDPYLAWCLRAVAEGRGVAALVEALLAMSDHCEGLTTQLAASPGPPIVVSVNGLERERLLELLAASRPEQITATADAVDAAEKLRAVEACAIEYYANLHRRRHGDLAADQCVAGVCKALGLPFWHHTRLVDGKVVFPPPSESPEEK